MRNYGQYVVFSRVSHAFRTATRTLAVGLGAGVCAFLGVYLTFTPEGLVSATLGLMKYSALLKIRPTLEKSAKQYFYRGYFETPSYETVVAVALVSGVVVGVAATVGAFYLFRWADRRLKADKRVRGEDLLSPKELNKESLERWREDARDLTITKDKIRFPFSMLRRNLALIGQNGRGKSNLIREILVQLRGKSKVMILDLNGEFYQSFGQAGDRILSLGDTRSVPWDFWSEDLLPETLASYLVADDPKGQRFFTKGPQSLLAALLRHSSSVEGLETLVTQDQQTLIDFLKSKGEQGAADIIGKAGSTQAAGVKGALGIDFSPLLREMRKKEETGKRFSIMNWLQDNEDSRWVFVVVRDDEFALAMPLLQCWVNAAVAGCLRRNPDDENRQFVLVCDEVRSLGNLRELPKALERVRKYQGSVVLGYQNNAQLQDVYGENMSRVMKDNTLTKFIYNSSDPASQKELSEMLGQKMVKKLVEEEELGPDNRSSTKKSYRESKEPLVTPEEIGALPDLHYYVKLGELPPCKTSSTYVTYAKKNARMDYRKGDAPSALEPTSEPVAPTVVSAAPTVAPTTITETAKERGVESRNPPPGSAEPPPPEAPGGSAETPSPKAPEGLVPAATSSQHHEDSPVAPKVQEPPKGSTEPPQDGGKVALTQKDEGQVLEPQEVRLEKPRPATSTESRFSV